MSRLQISLHMGLPVAPPLRLRLESTALLCLFPLVFPFENVFFTWNEYIYAIFAE